VSAAAIKVDPADKRAAVDMSVKLSAQLIATAVGVLAILGAFSTYAWSARDVGWTFAVIVAFAAFALMASIVFAGKGISHARAAGFRGDWSLSEGKSEFNSQAWAGLMALILLLVAFFIFLFAQRRGDVMQNVGPQAVAAIEQLSREVAEMRHEIQRSRADVMTFIANHSSPVPSAALPNKMPSAPNEKRPAGN